MLHMGPCGSTWERAPGVGFVWERKATAGPSTPGPRQAGTGGMTLLFEGWGLDGKIWEARGAHRRPLGFPGFPVESCGFGRLHVVLFRENHISGRQ